MSPFSLRKGLNVRVNLGPRISKKGCFLNFLDISEKKCSFFLINYENNSSDNLYQHSDKKKHIVWLLTIDFSKIYKECTGCKNVTEAIAYSILYKLCEL